MTFTQTSIALTFLSLMITGCKGESDIQSPVIDIVSFTPSPRVGEVCGEANDQVFFVASGDSLFYEVIFKDDQALSQYKIDIHQNFDCHGHARSTEDWTLLEIQDISGTEVPVSGYLKVPSDVTAGNYHFQIQVVDEAGNDDPLSNIYAIVVTNKRDTIAPELAISAPAAGTFSAKKGDLLTFTGLATDNYSLGEGGNGKLLLTYTRLTSGNTFEALRLPFSESATDRESINAAFTIPTTLVADSYRFVLSVFDGVNNESDRISWDVQIE